MPRGVIVMMMAMCLKTARLSAGRGFDDDFFCLALKDRSELTAAGFPSGVFRPDAMQNNNDDVSVFTPMAPRSLRLAKES